MFEQTFSPSSLKTFGFCLLWIESLVAALLLVSVVDAFLASSKKSMWRKWAVLGVAAIPLLAGGACTLLGWYFILPEHLQPNWFFAYALTWSIAYLALCITLLNRGNVFQGGIASKALSIKRATAFAIASIILVTTFFTMDHAEKEKFAAYRTYIDAQGKSVIPKPVPAKENAALIYKKAYDMLVDHDRDAFLKNSQLAEIDPAAEKTQRFIIMQRRAIELAHMAAAMDHFYIPVKLSFDSFTPSILPYIHLTKLIALDARVKAAHGDIDGAFEDISLIHHMAGHLGKTPIMILSLLSSRTHRTACLTQEYLLNHIDALPKKIQAHFAAQYSNLIYNHFQQTVKAEGLLLKSTIANEMGGNSASSTSLNSFFIGSVYRIFFAPYDAAFMENYWQQLGILYQQPPHAALANMTRLIEKNIGEVSILSDTFTTLDYTAATKYIITTQARLLLADTALSIAQYRNTHGDNPTRWADLIPDYIPQTPIDPYTGKPLQIKQLDNGLIIYSLGPDLKDDHGSPYQKFKKTGDIAFYMGSAYAKYSGLRGR